MTSVEDISIVIISIHCISKRKGYNAPFPLASPVVLGRPGKLPKRHLADKDRAPYALVVVSQVCKVNGNEKGGDDVRIGRV